MSRRTHMTMDGLEPLLQALNEHEINAIVEAVSNDAEFVPAVGPAPDGQSFEGQDAIRDALAARLAASGGRRRKAGCSATAMTVA